MGRPLLTRLSTTGGHAIFCHFLNRELHESIGDPLDFATALRAIQLCSVFHNEPMFCNISQIYEAAAPNPDLMEEISELIQADIFVPYSEYDRSEEFLASRRKLYSHDKERYGMYFGEHETIAIRRSAMRGPRSSSTTTEFIAEALTRWDEGPNAVDRAASPQDARALRPHSLLLRRATQDRNNRGMTAALFRSAKLELLVDPQTEGALRRALSGLYVEHYLDAFNSLPILHLPGLAYYDRPHGQPMLSFGMLCFLARTSGLDAFLKRQPDFSRVSRIHGYHSPAKAPLHSSLNRLSAALRALGQELGASVFDWGTMRVILGTLGGLAQPSERIASTFDDAIFSADQRVNLLCEQLALSNEMAAKAMREHEGIQLRLLIATATDTEDHALRETFSANGILVEHTDFSGRSSIRYLGVHGGIAIFHVRSSAGGDGPSGAQAVLSDAIQRLTPNFIISVGICAGLKPKKQKLGDVAVSSSLRHYEPQRVGEQSSIPRGSRLDASALLLDRIRDLLTLGDHPPIHTGLFLSGEKLVDSRNFREHLLGIEPEAIALEMEGAGITSAADRYRIEWIIVKGISDFAAQKGENAQALAANNAFSVVARLIKRGALNATVLK